METISFQDLLLKLSLHTSIIKHTPHPNYQKGSIQKMHKKMEQNLPIAAKKFWHTVRVVYFMLRKNVSKPKLFADLNVIMKRGKLAGKSAIHNLMPHHHHHEIPPVDAPADHPAFRLPFHLNKRKRSPSPEPSDADLFAAAMEIVEAAEEKEDSSPALPGFGRTPVVRQLRITDSPFPLRPEAGGADDDHVDEAAEKFIMRFYRELKRQNTMSPA